jgi:hypothetical protein
MGLFGMAKNMLGGLGKSAAIGGGLGYMNTGDLGGIAGGAAAGAAFGMFGLPAGRKYLGGLLGRRSPAGMAAAGLERAGRGALSLGWGSNSSTLMRGATRAFGGLNTAAGFIGRNATMVNKVGGYGLAALGMGASAHIGSSVISSNRGY